MFFPSTLAAAACTLLVAARASPDAFPFTPEPAHQLVNRADVIITTGATGDAHPRLEINCLAGRDDQWALFIKTMAKWKQGTEEDTSSYYSVASIHGVPQEDWNGVQQCEGCGGAIGYGTHDLPVFPGWHRTYLAEFEQRFLEAAREVVESFSPESRDRMRAALETLRLPYWDWAAAPESNSSALPPMFTSTQITINGPDGPETLENPLYSFKFTEAQARANYFPVFTGWTETYRYPSSQSTDSSSQNDEAASALQSMQTSLQDQVYQILTACDDYNHFARDEADGPSKCANSLEQIHNTVHTVAGGTGDNGDQGGHVAYLPLSSYDPVFWCHHANIDRIFALWQTINPDSWISGESASHSTWAIAEGEFIDGNYPLKPFNKDSSSYWTSNDVRDWTVLGYNYPEFTVSRGEKSDIAKFVNGLYGNQASLSASEISAQVPETQAKRSGPTKSPPNTRGNNSTSPGNNSTGHGYVPGFNHTVPSYSAPPSYPAPPSYHHSTIGDGLASLLDRIVDGVEDMLEAFIDAATGNAYEYACNIRTPRYALNGSYYVYVFNGEPESESPSTWLHDENLLGVMGVLSTPTAMPGHNTIVSGQIPLTRALRSLVTVGSLLGMDEENILPFLTKNLQWRISKNGVEVDVDSVEGFKVSVYSSQASVPKEAAHLPTYTKYTPRVEVTKGKVGGAAKPLFGSGNDDEGDDHDEDDDSGSSSSPEHGTSKPHAPSYGSSTKKTSPSGHASSPSAPAPDAYSFGSYAPSASPYKSLEHPASYPTAPAGAIPTPYESWATISQPPETCDVVTTTVKRYETIYVTAGIPPTHSAPPPSKPVESSPVVPSAPVAYPSTGLTTTVPVAPYPVPSASSPAYYPIGTGSPIAPVYPTGTGKVYPSSPVAYTGAAKQMSVAGLFIGLGAMVAFFM